MIPLDLLRLVSLFIKVVNVVISLSLGYLDLNLTGFSNSSLNRASSCKPNNFHLNDKPP